MFPQLSKSHTSLAYRNTFHRDCVKCYRQPPVPAGTVVRSVTRSPQWDGPHSPCHARATGLAASSEFWAWAPRPGRRYGPWATPAGAGADSPPAGRSGRRAYLRPSWGSFSGPRLLVHSVTCFCSRRLLAPGPRFGPRCPCPAAGALAWAGPRPPPPPPPPPHPPLVALGCS
jgi:hypothetical protein